MAKRLDDTRHAFAEGSGLRRVSSAPRSRTIWRSRADFEAWTKSEAFRLAHQSAGQNKPLYLGHPEFEGFEVIQTVDKGKS
jgi:hypothetical protein